MLKAQHPLTRESFNLQFLDDDDNEIDNKILWRNGSRFLLLVDFSFELSQSYRMEFHAIQTEFNFLKRMFFFLFFFILIADACTC